MVLLGTIRSIHCEYSSYIQWSSLSKFRGESRGTTSVYVIFNIPEGTPLERIHPYLWVVTLPPSNACRSLNTTQCQLLTYLFDLYFLVLIHTISNFCSSLLCSFRPTSMVLCPTFELLMTVIVSDREYIQPNPFSNQATVI